MILKNKTIKILFKLPYAKNKTLINYHVHMNYTHQMPLTWLLFLISDRYQYEPPYSWFIEVLKFRKWLIFSFFMILFSQMGLPKAQALQWVVHFFKGLNFTKDQHPQNSWSLCTLKKPTIQYVFTSNMLSDSIILCS